MQIQDFSTSSVQPYKVLLAALKTSIKDDATSIRAEKTEIRNLQKTFGSGGAASLQSRLHLHRLEARARLLVYGVMRGRTWDQIEAKHALFPQLKYAIQRVYTQADKATQVQVGVSVPMPDSVKALLV